MITEKRFAVINGIDSMHSIIRIMVMLCVMFATPFSTPQRAQHAGEVVKEASIRKKGEKPLLLCHSNTRQHFQHDEGQIV